jgi:hypothetical protein
MAAFFTVRAGQDIQDNEECPAKDEKGCADHGTAIQTDHHPAMSRAMANSSRAIIALHFHGICKQQVSRFL